MARAARRAVAAHAGALCHALCHHADALCHPSGWAGGGWSGISGAPAACLPDTRRHGMTLCSRCRGRTSCLPGHSSRLPGVRVVAGCPARWSGPRSGWGGTGQCQPVRDPALTEGAGCTILREACSRQSHLAAWPRRGLERMVCMLSAHGMLSAGGGPTAQGQPGKEPGGGSSGPLADWARAGRWHTQAVACTCAVRYQTRPGRRASCTSLADVAAARQGERPGRSPDRGPEPETGPARADLLRLADSDPMAPQGHEGGLMRRTCRSAAGPAGAPGPIREVTCQL